MQRNPDFDPTSPSASPNVFHVVPQAMELASWAASAIQESNSAGEYIEQLVKRNVRVALLVMAYSKPDDPPRKMLTCTLAMAMVLEASGEWNCSPTEFSNLFPFCFDLMAEPIDPFTDETPETPETNA